MIRRTKNYEASVDVRLLQVIVKKCHFMSESMDCRAGFWIKNSWMPKLSAAAGDVTQVSK